MTQHTHATLPHAAYVTGDNAAAAAGVRTLLTEYGCVVDGNPDVIFTGHTTFTVDDARELKRRAANKPVDAHLVHVISFAFTTREAQNALLKLLEEPAPNAHIILIVRNSDTLLPTIRSRCTHLGYFVDTPAHGDADAFLSGTPKERREIIQPILDEKDKVAAQALLDALERAVYARGDTSTHAQSLHTLLFAREGLTVRAPSIKMLLEYIVVALPRMS